MKGRLERPPRERKEDEEACTRPVLAKNGKWCVVGRGGLEYSGHILAEAVNVKHRLHSKPKGGVSHNSQFKDGICSSDHAGLALSITVTPSTLPHTVLIHPAEDIWYATGTSWGCPSCGIFSSMENFAVPQYPSSSSSIIIPPSRSVWYQPA